MGCCELEKQTDKGELFIQETVKQFKISCMDLSNVKDILSDLSTIREKVDKNILIANLDRLRNNNLYESRLFETILNQIKDTFTVNELLFYLLPFTKIKSENPYSDLYELFINLINDEEFTVEVFEKILSDYLRFFTFRINMCFASVIKGETEEIKNKVSNLNEKIYNKNNFRTIINNIIGTYEDKEVVTLEIFTTMLSDYKIFDFISIRNIFISSFEEI